MTILHRIKQAQLQARKDRNTASAASLTTLIGEAEAVGKTDGNRETTDAEVVALIKKFIKNVDAVIAAVQQANGDTSQYVTERELYNSFLPKQMSEDELRTTISGIIAELGATTAKSMGAVMSTLKSRHEGTYPGDAASKIVKQLLTA